MVNKTELETALANQLTLFNESLDKTLDDKLAKMKKEIIDEIKNDIKDEIKKDIQVEIKNEIEADLFKNEIDLETIIQRNLQYQRKTNVVINGVPNEIDHDSLEQLIIDIFNRVCLHQISSRDIVAVHRISKTSDNVLCKFVNQKDAIALLNSYVAIRNLKFESIGISSTNKIYVNEHLSAFIAKLAYHCRLMYKADLIISTKVVKGVVKIQTKNFQWVIIEHKNDIKKYVPEFVIKDD